MNPFIIENKAYTYIKSKLDISQIEQNKFTLAFERHHNHILTLL